MVKGIEWRGGVNERFTGVEKADKTGRGGVPSPGVKNESGEKKTSPWQTPRARFATDRGG